MGKITKGVCTKVYYCSFVFTGETSSGKSRLVNLILGEEILPYSILSSTSTICELKFGEERKIKAHFKDEDRPAQTIVLEQPTGSSGKSYLDQISRFVHVDTHREHGSGFKKIELFWPHKLLEVSVVLKLFCAFCLSNYSRYQIDIENTSSDIISLKHCLECVFSG